MSLTVYFCALFVQPVCRRLLRAVRQVRRVSQLWRRVGRRDAGHPGGAHCRVLPVLPRPAPAARGCAEAGAVHAAGIGSGSPRTLVATCYLLLHATCCLLLVDLVCAFEQVVASASSAYSIPWPPSFNSFLATLRIFLVDVVSITRTNCAQPMNYYGSLMTVLTGTAYRGWWH